MMRNLAKGLIYVVFHPEGHIEEKWVLPVLSTSICDLLVMANVQCVSNFCIIESSDCIVGQEKASG